MALVDAGGALDRRPEPNEELRRRIAGMRAAGKAWTPIAAELGVAESTAIYHAQRVADRPVLRYRPVVATLTLAGLRVSVNCEHVDLARREIRVLDAKTPRACVASTSTTISKRSSPPTRSPAAPPGNRAPQPLSMRAASAGHGTRSPST